MPEADRSPSPLAELAAGAALLPRGLGLVAARPRLFLLGALPPLITSVLAVVALVTLSAHIDAVAAALTPFADGWTPGLAGLVRTLVGVVVVAGALLLLVVTFTTLTLALGGPLYDLISEAVDAGLPNPPQPTAEPLLRSAGRAVRQSLALVGLGLLAAVGLFALGLVPVAGQLAAPVLSALVGGTLLSLELVGSAAERRGLLTLAERRRLLGRRRALSLGLCVPTFLLLAVPFAGLVVFPAATAAAVLLVRRLTGEPGAG